MLILMGGMAQPLQVWEPIARTLASTTRKNVLLVEPLGVGESYTTITEEDNSRDNNSSPHHESHHHHDDDDYSSMGSLSLPAQARALYETIQSYAGNATATSSVQQQQQQQQPPLLLELDVVGFSLGARILMAYSLLYPGVIQKMHLTGIATERSSMANAAMKQWMTAVDMGGNDDDSNGGGGGRGGASCSSSTGTSILQTTYSKTYLQKNIDRIPQWANFIEQQQQQQQQQGPSSLRKLLQDTQDVGEWSVASMARRCLVTNGRLVVGEEDLMAPPNHATSLTRSLLGWQDPTIIMGAGHAVPFESSREWKRLVLDYLNS